jgi:hypothetical protein
MKHLVQEQSLGANLTVFATADIEPSLNAMVNVSRILKGLPEDVVRALS